MPLIGLVKVASFSDCSALMRSASAESMAAWSDAICWGVSVSAPDDPAPPVAPAPVDAAPVDARHRSILCPCRCVGAEACPAVPGVTDRVAACAATGPGPVPVRSRCSWFRWSRPRTRRRAPGRGRSRPSTRRSDPSTPAARPSRPSGAPPRTWPGRTWCSCWRWCSRSGPGPGRPPPCSGPFERVDWSLVSVLWSAVTVALWPPVVPRVGVGVVVVVDDGVEVWVLRPSALSSSRSKLASLSSSSTSLASSAATVDWADETDSLRAVVSSVPSVCPAVTTCPGVTVTVATWPATWNDGRGVADRLDGADHVERRSDVGPGHRGHAVARRSLPPTSAQAATPPPSTTTATTAPIRTARRWPARPQPEREPD